MQLLVVDGRICIGRICFQSTDIDEDGAIENESHVAVDPWIIVEDPFFCARCERFEDRAHRSLSCLAARALFKVGRQGDGSSLQDKGGLSQLQRMVNPQHVGDCHLGIKPLVGVEMEVEESCLAGDLLVGDLVACHISVDLGQDFVEPLISERIEPQG